jgi:demethylmenaquinone methyltransferase/2-methoxy-6-polyprenyl-1,4-benzoquinol methylase
MVLTNMSKNSNHSSEGASEEQYTYFGAERVEIQSKTQRVGEVFTSVAERYDLMNDLLSGGLHRRWKGDLVAWMAPGSERRSYLHVDLAGGTGDVAYRVQNVAGAAARSIVVDINEAMVRRGVRRLESVQLAV